MKSKPVLILSVLALALLIFFALKFYNTNLSEPESEPLKIEWTFWPGFYPMAIAQELKLFDKHNVKVESLLYHVGGKAVSDFAAKKLDAIMIATGDILELSTQTPLNVVLVIDNSDGADQVVATPDISTVADLQGKKLGYFQGDFSELFIRKMLEMNNLGLDDVTSVITEAEKIPEALPDLVDAGHTWEPYTTEAVEAGNNIIFSSADTPGLIADILVFHAAVVEERPEDIRAFIAAWFEAVEFWETNPDEAAQMIAKHIDLEPTEVSKEGVKMFNLEDNKIAFTKGNATTSLYVSMQEYIDFFVASGDLGKLPDLDQLLLPAFLE